MRAKAAGDPGPWRHQQADSVEKFGFYSRHTGFTFVTAGLAHHFQGVFDVLLSLQARVLGDLKSFCPKQAHLSRDRWSLGDQLGQPPQILYRCGEHELIGCASQPA